VGHLVDRLLLDQEEEALAILGEHVERFDRHVAQRHHRLVQVALALDALIEHLLVGEQPEQLVALGGAQPVGASDVLVAEILRPRDQVALGALALLRGVLRRHVLVGARAPRRRPPVLASAQDHVGAALLEVLARDLALVAAVGHLRTEGRRRGVGDLRGRARPVALPTARARSSSVGTGSPFTSTPTAPLNVRTPLANAVAPAAESVTASSGSAASVCDHPA
jgi:hypothetical protein